MMAMAAVAAVILPLSAAAAARPTATRSARPAPPRVLKLLHTFPLRSIRQSRGNSAVSVPFPVAVDSRHHWAYVGNLDGLSAAAVSTRHGVPTELGIPGLTGSIGVVEKTGLAYIPDAVESHVCATVLRGSRHVTTITGPACNETEDATVNPRTGLVYLDNVGTSEMDVIRGRHVAGTFRAGTTPGPGVANPRTGLVYIPNRGSNTVTIVKNRHVISTIKLSGEPGAVAVDASRDLAYVSDLNDEVVWVIHGHSARSMKAVTADSTFGVAVNPLTHLTYVLGTTKVSVLAGTTVKRVITLSLGDGDPRQAVVDPVNGLVYLIGEGSVIDVVRGARIIQRVPTTPSRQKSAALDTGNGRLIVADGDGNAIEVLQGPRTPTIDLRRPTGHAVYRQGSHVDVAFRCTPGRRNPVRSCRGTQPSGHRLATGRLGSHHFTVRLRSAYGPTVVKRVSYRVG
jgi:YVTN family beta-propeller protein